MTRKLLNCLSLNFKIQIGSNDDGSAIIKNKHLNNIYPKAQEDDIIYISNLFKSVLKGTIITSEIVEHYTLTNN